MSYVVGVDGCRGGWVACRYEYAAARLSYETLPTFADVLTRYAGARCIGVDMPIGLRDDGQPRRCDLEARQILGWPRASSVFAAPARCLLKEDGYAAANKRSRELSGKGLTKQAFNIFSKIGEVDALMTPEIQRRVSEVHPEVCFWHWGGRAMQEAKRTVAGYEERRNVLMEAVNVAIPERDTVQMAKPDDVLDATVVALTARRIALGKASRVPQAAELDGRGLRMEIVY